jgi:phage FluMu protein Com
MLTQHPRCKLLNKIKTIDRDAISFWCRGFNVLFVEQRFCSVGVSSWGFSSARMMLTQHPRCKLLNKIKTIDRDAISFWCSDFNVSFCRAEVLQRECVVMAAFPQRE